jgi:hypothetical protein
MADRRGARCEAIGDQIHLALGACIGLQ